MNREHYTTFDDFTLDEITSAVCARLEGSRMLLEEFGSTGDAFEGIIDDATDKLRHLQKLSREHDWPERSEQSTGQPFDRERYRRGMSVLQVLLAKMDSDDSSGLQACDTLESAIKELQAAGGLEQ